MKKSNTSRALVVLTVVLLSLSFGFGFKSYTKAEQKVVSDLNRALQQTVRQQSAQWLSQDTLQHYSKLQTIWDSPVSINSCSQYFTKALSITQLKETAGILVHIAKANSEIATSKELPDDYITSDTILYMSAITEKATASATSSNDISLSFRGYARCPMTVILLLSDQTLPLSLLFLAALSAFVAHRLSRIRQTSDTTASTKNSITFGNLSYCPDKCCFYNTRQERLRLTPLQLTLMEMFYQSPTHLLTKTDIYKALWPGKENADETLYTLIRRLKPIVEENSNLRITTDRGRAYVLEIGS